MRARNLHVSYRKRPHISYTVSVKDQWQMQSGYHGMLKELVKGLWLSRLTLAIVRCVIKTMWHVALAWMTRQQAAAGLLAVVYLIPAVRTDCSHPVGTAVLQRLTTVTCYLQAEGWHGKGHGGLLAFVRTNANQWDFNVQISSAVTEQCTQWVIL